MPKVLQDLKKQARLEQIDKELRLIEIDEELAQIEQAEDSGLRGVGRGLAMGARDIAAGLGRVADFVMTPVEMARYASQYIDHKIAPKYFDAPTYGKYTNLGPSIADKIDTATGDYTKPRNAGQQLASEIGQALVSLPVGGGIGMGISKAAPRMGKALVEMSAPSAANIGGIASTIGGSHLHRELRPEASTLEKLGVGLGSGIAGSYAAHKAAPFLTEAIMRPKDMLARGVGKVTSFDPEKYRAGIELGLNPTLGQSSQRSWPLGLELMGAKLPWTQGPLMENMQSNIAKISKHTGIDESDLWKAVENPKTYLAKQGAQKYHEAQNEAYRAAKARTENLEHQIKVAGEEYPSSDLLNEIQQHKVGLTKKVSKKNFQKSPLGYLETQLIEAAAEGSSELGVLVKAAEKQGFNPDTIKKALGIIDQQGGATTNYAHLEQLEKNLFDKMQDAKPRSAERRDATIAFKMVRDHNMSILEEAARHPEQLAAIKEAKNIWSEYKNPKRSDRFRHVDELLEMRTDDAAFNALTRGDRKYLEVVNAGLNPEERQQLAASVMSQAGKAKGHFNPVKGFDAFDKWKPEVQKTYLSMLGGKDAQNGFLKAKRLVEQNAEQVNAIANTSATAPTAFVMSTAKKTLGNIGKIVSGGVAAKGVQAMAGIEGLLATGLGLLVTRGGAKLTTNPTFLSRVNRVMTARNSKSAINAVDMLFKAPVVRSLMIEMDE